MRIADLKRDSTEIQLDTINLNYDRHGFLTILKQGIEVAAPCSINNLDLVSFMKESVNDLLTGDMKISAWENPDVALPSKIYDSEYIALSYWILLSYVNLKDTRDLWKKFTRQKSTFLTYIKNNLFASQLINQYKIALLTCYLHKFDLSDLDKIKQVFVRNNLHENNYIYYVLFIMEERYGSFTFDNSDVCVLTGEDLDREAQDVIKENMPLFMWHTRSSLSFIVSSHRMNQFEMINELATATQIAYNRVRPFKSKAYAESYAKRALTNTVNRIIYAYTHYDSLKRLISTDDGYVNQQLELTSNATAKDVHPEACDIYQSLSSLSYSEDALLDRIDRNSLEKAEDAALECLTRHDTESAREIARRYLENSNGPTQYYHKAG